MNPSVRTPALRFAVLGFPVRIEVSFLLIVAMLGFGGSLGDLAVWVVVATLSVLGHELGHALAARRVGATATIALEGLAGLTRTSRAAALSRREDAFVSAAGPGAGLLLGLLAYLSIGMFGLEAWTTGGWIVRLVIYTTAGWSVLNLLPILPLDGGQLLQAALPGSARQRQRRAAQVSIAVAAVGALVAYRTGMGYAAFFAFLLGAQNLATIREIDRVALLGELEALFSAGRFDDTVEEARRVAGAPRTAPLDRIAARRYAVVALVSAGRHDEARDELDRSPEASELGKGFRGFVVVAGGEVERGLDLARMAFGEDPGPETALWLLQALVRAGRHDEASAVVGRYAGLVSFDLAHKAWAAAFQAGDYAAAARIGDAVAAQGDPAHASLAYNAACSWARAGAPEEAAASLEAAVRLGWSDLGQLDTDEDLDGLRRSPHWPAFRATLAGANGR